MEGGRLVCEETDAVWILGNSLIATYLVVDTYILIKEFCNPLLAFPCLHISTTLPFSRLHLSGLRCVSNLL